MLGRGVLSGGVSKVRVDATDALGAGVVVRNALANMSQVVVMAEARRGAS